MSTNNLRHELDPNLKIWRYMDLSKFVQMISTSSLFFSRSDLLGDQFEGSLPRLVRDNHEQGLRELFKKQRGEGVSIYGFPTFGDRIDEDRISQGRLFREAKRKEVFVNSWHENPDESAAMWKLYKSDIGIAIVSTVGKLSHAVSAYPYHSIHKIRYVNLKTENHLSLEEVQFPFLIKDKSFEHEREIRAIYSFQKHDPNYISEDITGWSAWVNMSDLLIEVVIDPDSKPWCVEMVGHIIEKWGLAVSIRQSEMARTPDW